MEKIVDTKTSEWQVIAKQGVEKKDKKESALPMYLESFSAGILTLRVSQARKQPKA